MFDTRLHHISPGDAINKRKIWEGFLQWANRLSRLDSDCIARLQFEPGDFTLDSFLEMSQFGFDVGSETGLISGESGSSVIASGEIVSLDVSGDYWVDWSANIKLLSGQSRFVGGIPFVGNEFFGSAQDFKAVMGWLQNSTSQKSSKQQGSDGLSSISDEQVESVSEDYDYGLKGQSWDNDFSIRNRSYVPSRFSDFDTSIYYHLSGCGSASIPRITGKAGVLLFCQEGSKMQVNGARMSLRRRVR